MGELREVLRKKYEKVCHELSKEGPSNHHTARSRLSKDSTDEDNISHSSFHFDFGQDLKEDQSNDSDDYLLNQMCSDDEDNDVLKNDIHEPDHSSGNKCDSMTDSEDNQPLKMLKSSPQRTRKKRKKGKNYRKEADDDDSSSSFQNSEKGHELVAEYFDIKCDVCGKRFGYVSDFRKHCLHTHLMKPHLLNCLRCENRFKRGYEMREHIMFHNNPNVFYCDKCNTSYCSKRRLHDHLYAKHKLKQGRKGRSKMTSIN